MNPTRVEHASTSRPNGPVRTAVRTHSRTTTARPALPGSTFSAALDITFPDQIVSAYPMADARAVENSIRTNPWLMNPSSDSPAISPMASAVPDLPFPETERVTRDSTDVTVPIDATVDMKRSGRSSGNSAADMDAPTVDVIPGNHPATVPMSTPSSPGTGPTGSATESLWIGILAAEEVSSSTGMPNRPVSSGSMMLPSPPSPSIGISRVMQARPSIPDAANATAPQSALPLPCPDMTTTAAATIMTTGVSLSRGSSRPFRRSHCSGTESRIEAAAPMRLPMAAALTAAIPLPSRRSLCPGSTETASSPSGAPMNTDGTKSTNEWTTEADIMQTHTASAVPSWSRPPGMTEEIDG